MDVRATRVPTGSPLDALHATADHQQVLQAARDAEERAREVMREYESMTTTRIAALPPDRRTAALDAIHDVLVRHAVDRVEIAYRTTIVTTAPADGTSFTRP